MKTIILKPYPELLNTRKVRLHASLVSLITLLSLITFWLIHPVVSLVITSFLFLDFLFTFLFGPNRSFFSSLVETLHQKYQLFSENWVSPRPKRFAKFCGLSILLISFLFYPNNLYVFFLSLLALFSFLEAAFNYCVACKLFSLGQRIGIVPPDDCKNC
ncbi:MAG: DUF4395 domain-containing protein [Leptospiraceae bacterium]|nr:DUF4395 domain-containing protein [Leptospiraceae bacterium]MDW7975521.1 DUF4395 family protein [Leptospiraceae bacterium]